MKSLQRRRSTPSWLQRVAPCGALPFCDRTKATTRWEAQPCEPNAPRALTAVPAANVVHQHHRHSPEPMSGSSGSDRSDGPNQNHNRDQGDGLDDNRDNRSTGTIYDVNNSAGPNAMRIGLRKFRHRGQLRATSLGRRRQPPTGRSDDTGPDASKLGRETLLAE